MDRAVPGAATRGKSGPGSYGNEVVLHIPQSSSIIGASPSDYLVSYPGHSLEKESYPSAEMQSVYSTAPADWDTWTRFFPVLHRATALEKNINLRSIYG